MRETADQLNAATRELEALCTQSARLQTMALAIAAELGCSREEMLSIRANILFGSPKLASEKLPCCLSIAYRWNTAWERKEVDIIRAVRLEIGDSAEVSMWLAFERAASKIHPIRP